MDRQGLRGAYDLWQNLAPGYGRACCQAGLSLAFLCRPSDSSRARSFDGSECHWWGTGVGGCGDQCTPGGQQKQLDGDQICDCQRKQDELYHGILGSQHHCGRRLRRKGFRASGHRMHREAWLPCLGSSRGGRRGCQTLHQRWAGHAQHQRWRRRDCEDYRGQQLPGRMKKLTSQELRRRNSRNLQSFPERSWGPGDALTSRLQRERGKRGELFDADQSLGAVQIGAGRGEGAWDGLGWPGGSVQNPGSPVGWWLVGGL